MKFQRKNSDVPASNYENDLSLQAKLKSNSRDDVKNEMNEKLDQKEKIEKLFDVKEPNKYSMHDKGRKSIVKDSDSGYDNIQNELKDME